MKSKLLVVLTILIAFTACTSKVIEQQATRTPIDTQSAPLATQTSLLDGVLSESHDLIGSTTEYKKFVIINENLADEKILQKGFLVDKFPNPTKYQLIAQANLPGITGLDNYRSIKNGYNVLQVYFNTMIFSNDGTIVTTSIQKENPNEIKEGTLVYIEESEKLENPVIVSLSREGTGPVGTAKIDVTTGKIVKGTFKPTQ